MNAIGPDYASPVTSLPRTQPTPPTSGRKLDAERVRFKMMLELRHSDASTLNRVLKGTGWSCRPAPDDCSHSSEGCRYGGYVHLESPAMTLAEGALNKVAEAIERIRTITQTTGTTAAMRFLVDAAALDDEGVTNLVNLHLANEALLYRLGASGGRGRDIEHKTQYCSPLSTGTVYTRYAHNLRPAGNGGWAWNGAGLGGHSYHARFAEMRSFSARKSVQEWRTQLADRHWGMNASQQGWWEFRYFDSSLDAEGVKASVQLLLGMVKAAAEGRGQWDKVRPLPEDRETVSRARWTAFLDTVAPPAIHAQLERSFIAAGGQLEKEVISREALHAYGELVQTGYQFDVGGTSLAEAMSRSDSIRLRLPAGGYVSLRTSQVDPFLRAATGRPTALPELQSRLDAAWKLHARGVTFHNGECALPPPLAAVMASEAGQVHAARGEESIPVSDMTELLTLETAPADPLKSVMSDIQWLADRGHSATTASGLPIRWPVRVAHAFRSGDLRVDGKPVESAAALVQEFVQPARIRALNLSDERCTLLLNLHDWMTRMGVALSSPPGHVELIPQSLERQQAFQVGSIPVASWRELEVLLTNECDAARSQDDSIRHIGRLRAAGVTFSSSLNTEVSRELANGATRVRLPRWTWWNWWPRKTITITPDSLPLLSQRLVR